MEAFVIVEFIGNDCVEVVCSHWLNKGDPNVKLTTFVACLQQLFCYWPPNAVTRKVKKQELPDIDKWLKYEVRILASADNYKKARDLCQVAVDTSNVEEENGKRKRTSTQTVFSDYDQSDVEEQREYIKKKKNQIKNIKKSTVSNENNNNPLPNPPDWLSGHELSSHDVVKAVVNYSVVTIEQAEHSASLSVSNESPNVASKNSTPVATERGKAKIGLVSRNIIPPSPVTVQSQNEYSQPRQQLASRNSCSPTQELVPSSQKEYSQPRQQLASRNNTPLERVPSSPEEYLQPGKLVSRNSTPSLNGYSPQISQVLLQNDWSQERVPSQNVFQQQQMSQLPARYTYPQHSKGISSGNEYLQPSERAISRNAGPQQTHSTTGFQAKIDTIIENQEEMLNILKHLVSVSQAAGSSGDMLEDFFPQRIDSMDEFDQFNERLGNLEFRKKMVNILCTTGGKKLGTTVRNIMRRIASNVVWSDFSLKGRKGKLPIIDLSICRLVMRTCRKLFNKATDTQIQEEIAEVLRQAPNRPGGKKFKSKAKTAVIHPTEDSMDTADSDE